MNIRMIGIDHEKASLNQREIFAFTASQAKVAMQQVVTEFGFSGAVLISTCNRTELWVSGKGHKAMNLAELMLQLKGIPLSSYPEFSSLWVERNNRKAAQHLFRTACGLKSQIFGEDQILTQIKNAIEAAREVNASDTMIEKLFQMAITSAKRIKTDVRITCCDSSIALHMVDFLEDHIGDLSQKTCMVVGNGEMGRLAASELGKKSLECSVTLRSYKNRDCTIPDYCQPMNYEDRYLKMEEFDIVVSATSSPHYTIREAELRERISHRERPLTIIDLAVPRDVEPKISELNNVFLFDIDHLGVDRKHVARENIILAEEIMEEYLEDFEKWHRLKEFLPAIKNIAQTTTQRISNNMKRELDALELNDREKKFLEKRLANISESAVSGLLFNVKDSIEMEHWETCFKNLEKTVR